ncbi:MAG: hypothetical protein AAF281_06735 [Pseudomonadota bacterium]
MPRNVTFHYKSHHTYTKQNGYIFPAPALPRASRLYVIYNSGKDRHPYYIGTAQDVQHRFDTRSKAIRDLGIKNDELARIQIAVVQILVNGRATTPGKTGVAGGIDVEHLLIRIYSQIGNFGLRNMSKTGIFSNVAFRRLDYYFTWDAGLDFSGFYANDGHIGGAKHL